MRRARDELLVLRKPGVPDRLLARGSDESYGVFGLDLVLPSQRRFQVSPDTRVLAYTEPSTGDLHLLRRDGALDLPDDVLAERRSRRHCRKHRGG